MVLNGKIVLNERLSKAMSFVVKCDCMADIGSDHGYAAVYAIQSNIAQRVIATDISAPSLAKTQRLSEEYGLKDKISCRVGNGFSPIACGEANTALIAGMGAELIADILEASTATVASLDCVVLQPMNNAEPLRRRLCNAGLKIDSEGIVKDNGRFYQILKCSAGAQTLSELEYEIGTFVYNERIPLCAEFITHMINDCNNILRYIGETDTELSRTRAKAVLSKKEEYERALEWALSK